MAGNFSAEQTLDPNAIWSNSSIKSKGWSRHNFEHSKWILVVNDMLLSAAMWFISAWALTMLPSKTDGLLHSIGALLVYAGLTIGLFPSHGLYCRHSIFFLRKHMADLARAFSCSLTGFIVLYAVYSLPASYDQQNTLAMAVILLVSAAALLGVWLACDGPWQVFKILGFSLLSVGCLGMPGEGNVPYLIGDAGAMAFSYAAVLASVTASRLFLVHIVFNKLFKRHFRQQVAIVGTDAQACRIVSYVIKHNAPFWVTGTIGEHCRLGGEFEKDCLGPIEYLPRIAQAHHIDELIITDKRLDKRTLICILDFCLTKGICVWVPPNLLEIIDRKLHLANFCGLPMIKMCSPKCRWISDKVKYAIDALLGLPLFIVLLPVFGTIAVAIKLNSKGPVFYRARAIGKLGREFVMFKFRSMKMNNDSHIHKNYVSKLIKGEIDTEEGKPLKITNDPRVTLVGRFLRKFSLDELPQLINVITGEMSIVGPRPCLPYEYELYKDWHKKRTCGRPGITGLWQVAGRSEVAFDDMILLDLYYLYNQSLWMDLNILVETVFVVLLKKGAY